MWSCPLYCFDKPASRPKILDICRNTCFTVNISCTLMKHIHSSLANNPRPKRKPDAGAGRRTRRRWQCPATSGRRRCQSAAHSQCRPAGVCARLAAARLGSHSAPDAWINGVETVKLLRKLLLQKRPKSWIDDQASEHHRRSLKSIYSLSYLQVCFDSPFTIFIDFIRTS